MANNYQQVQVHHIESLKTVFTEESKPLNGSQNGGKVEYPTNSWGTSRVKHHKNIQLVCRLCYKILVMIYLSL